MAGSYPDATSWRMAYDRDGTQVYRLFQSTLTQLTNTQLVKMNDELHEVVIDGGNALIFIFPQLRDLDGFFLRSAGGGVTVQTSVNSTNGVDGTWVTGVTVSGGPSLPTSPDYRNVNSTTKLGIRAVRFLGLGGTATIHLYGETTVGQDLDQLLLWSATSNERVSPAEFDWGTTPRSSTDDRYFRVKNTSSLLTAHNIRVAMEAPTDTIPSTPLQHVIAKDSSFLAQQMIGAIGPGAVSEIFTLRRITPSNAHLGLATFRLYAEAESWS